MKDSENGDQNLGRLIEDLKNESPGVRKKAVWSLGRVGGEKVTSLLIDALNNDPDKEVRMEAVYSLGWIESDESLGALYDVVINDRDELEIQQYICELLINEKEYPQAVLSDKIRGNWVHRVRHIKEK